MVESFCYFQPVKIFFGRGQAGRLAEILSGLGLESCVLVCDPFFGDKGRELMADCPMVKAVFSHVEPNPQLSGAKAAADLARVHGAQGIIGLGGGSSMDTAKFAAAIASGDAPGEICYATAKFPAAPLKIIAIPTTAGTGSEVTQVSVMNNGPEKKTINHPAFMPLAAVVDPELMVSVPPRVTMATGLDALAHALEGYWSKRHQPITDLFAIEAVRRALAYLERAYRDGADMEAREEMAYAALLAGLAFGQPKTAGSHACSYPLSMDYHLPHGEACAFTLDGFVRVNSDQRLEALARAVGLANTGALADRILELKRLGGMRCKLEELGEVDIEKLAADCAAHPLMQNNPVPMDAAAMREFLQKLS